MLPTQLIERPNKTAVHFLLSKLTNEFWAQHYMKDEDFNKKQSIVLTKKYLEECSKNNCVVRADYKPSKFDKHSILRLYGNGIQNIPSRFRGILFGDNTSDVDIVNCHPSILRHLCKINYFNCPQLDYYCDNRKKIIDDKLATKNEIVVSMYMSDSLMTYSPFLKLFDAEIKVLQKLFYDNERYKFIKDTVNISKQNPIGTFLSYLLQYHERLIISCVCKYFDENKIDICSQMFDGCMVYGEFNDIEALEKYVFENSSIPVKFAIKPHSSVIQIPDDFEYETNEDKYLNIKKKYEEEYKLAYIVSSNSFVIKQYGVFCIRTKTEMLTQMENIFYDEDNAFFPKWLKDPERKEYFKVESIPHDKECPDNVYNIWTGFAVEKIKGKIVSIEKILEHIRILMGRNEECFQFMMKWLANFFQFPSHTSVMPFIQGSEGAGKGIFIEFLRLLIGDDKFLNCDDIDNQLMGNFTGHLRDIMFVHIEEIDFNTTKKYVERIKSMITRSVININEKGLKPFTIPHYIKYFTTANPKNPFIITDNDRRISPIQSSDELLGNTVYFEEFGKLIMDKDIQYSFYKFIMSYKTIEQLGRNDIPETELRKDSKVLSRDSVEDFISEFSESSQTCDSNGIFSLYKQFMTKSNLSCNISLKSFQMKAKCYFDKYNVKSNKVDRTNFRRIVYYVGEIDEKKIKEMMDEEM